MGNGSIKDYYQKLVSLEPTLEPKEGESLADFKVKMLIGEPDYPVLGGSIRLGLKRGVLTLMPQGCTIPICDDDPYLPRIREKIDATVKLIYKGVKTVTEEDSTGAHLEIAVSGPKIGIDLGHKTANESKRETAVEKGFYEPIFQVWRQGMGPEIEWVFQSKGTSATLKGFIDNIFGTVECREGTGSVDVTFTARRKDIEIVDTEGTLVSIVNSVCRRAILKLSVTKKLPTQNNRLVFSQGSLQFPTQIHEREAAEVPLPQLLSVDEAELVSGLELTTKALLETKSDDFSGLLTAAGLNPMADLAGADLRGIDMRGIDLSGADLSATDFTGAKLTNANLSGCDLRFADFSRSHIDQLRIEDAIVNGTNVSSAIGMAERIQKVFLAGGARLTELPSNIDQALNIDLAFEPQLTFDATDAHVLNNVVERNFQDVHDGTTTAVLITQHILNAGRNAVAVGIDATELQKGITKAVNEAIVQLQSLSSPCMVQGGVTGATMEQKRERCVPGGGVALMRVAQIISQDAENEDQKIGVQMVQHAMLQPLVAIAVQARKNPAVVLRIVKQGDTYFGFDRKAGKYGDMMKMGIVDSVKLTEAALKSAASLPEESFNAKPTR